MISANSTAASRRTPRAGVAAAGAIPPCRFTSCQIAGSTESRERSGSAKALSGNRTIVV